MSRRWLNGCSWVLAVLGLVATQTGCSMSQIRHRMSHAWKGGIAGEEIGEVNSNDPWASKASEEMSAHHPPGYSDPSDRFFSSEQAREISRGFDGR